MWAWTLQSASAGYAMSMERALRRVLPGHQDLQDSQVRWASLSQCITIKSTCRDRHTTQISMCLMCLHILSRDSHPLCRATSKDFAA
jgi:hypothetical protein